MSDYDQIEAEKAIEHLTNAADKILFAAVHLEDKHIGCKEERNKVLIIRSLLDILSGGGYISEEGEEDFT